MVPARKRSLGDRLVITGGFNRGKSGRVIKLEASGITLVTDDGEEVRTGAGWTQFAEEVETPIENAEVAANEEDSTPLEADPSPPPLQGNATEGSVRTLPIDYGTLRFEELRQLAKQHGVSVARTKVELVHWIQEKEPDVDAATLKGHVLFSKVAEHHISRLRSKQELAELIQKAATR